MVIHAVHIDAFLVEQEANDVRLVLHDSRVQRRHLPRALVVQLRTRLCENLCAFLEAVSTCIMQWTVA